LTDSANFSYHLRQLTGHFVKRSDDGYSSVPRPPRSSARSSPAPSPIGRKLGSSRSGSCYDCDGDLHGWYVDDTLTVGCADCGTIQVRLPPSGGLDDRTTDELLQAFHHYVRHHYCLAARTEFAKCTGAVETTLVRDPDERISTSPSNTSVSGVTTGCGRRSGSPSWTTPETLLFFSERGVDLNTEPFWGSTGA